MARQETRKPLRERVAERKRQQMAEGRGASPSGKAPEDMTAREAETERQEKARLWWRRAAGAGTVLQAAALLAVIVEAYLLWQTQEPGQTRWEWIIIYAILFGAGRVLKMVGDTQAKSR